MLKKSAKIKGRRLQTYVKKKILKTFKHLKDADVATVKNGHSGPDILLSRFAKRIFSYNVECKNQETLKQIYSFYKQASKKTRLEPLLVIKRNANQPLVVVSADHFFDLIKIND